MDYQHVPVMLEEALLGLNIKPGSKVIDCTLGGAGYTLAIAKKVGPTGLVLALDLDDMAIKNAQKKISEQNISNIILVQENFRNLSTVISDNFPAGTLFDGVVMDLGLSSAQLSDEDRGFSFQGDRPLDMAFNQDLHTAIATTTIVNRYPLERLAYIFREYGEESKAYQVAKKIVEERRKKKIKTTGDLLAIISLVLKTNPKSRINPATKIFQALRMETNRELDALKEVIPAAIDSLKVGGRLSVVSFHSGEDRIVKEFFKKESLDCICPPNVPLCVCGHQAKIKVLTKKPIAASDVESRNNPRARSAKLRVAEKI
jgi:16S rRNA (cytosine1402-N4)-methyltransferase